MYINLTLYYSDSFSKELGIRLANSLLTLFDPTLIPEAIPDPDKLKLIPLYKNPKVHKEFIRIKFYNLITSINYLLLYNDLTDYQIFT